MTAPLIPALDASKILVGVAQVYDRLLEPLTSANLGDQLDQLQVRRSHVDHHGLDAGEGLVNGLGRNAALGLPNQIVDEVLAGLHLLGQVHRAQQRKKLGVFRHLHTPSLHGLDTRHVTGATVAASRWLQRRAWVRRVVLIARPSGTTEAGV